MIRKPYWDTRDFHEFLKRSNKDTFDWSENNCCNFAAKAIEAQTGVRIDDDFAGKYSDKVSAFKLIKSVTGGSNVADAAAYCAEKHGLPELQYPLLAQRGDLVVFPNTDGELIAGVIHTNGRHAVSLGETGTIAVPISKVVRAWSVSGTHAHPKAFNGQAKAVTNV